MKMHKLFIKKSEIGSRIGDVKGYVYILLHLFLHFQVAITEEEAF